MRSLQHPSNWRAADLQQDQSWILSIDEPAREEMIQTVVAVADSTKTLFDYRREDFTWPRTSAFLSAALQEVKHRRGIALIKGLPRPELTAHQFEILTWGLGLHAGVPRPQGKETQYISAVRWRGMMSLCVNTQNRRNGCMRRSRLVDRVSRRLTKAPM
jgi:hypothetical protein